MEILSSPWPWYITGPIIGLTVPILLFFGNKKLGVSSTLRQICAACVPSKIPMFNYDWKKDSWNLFFVLGIFIGGFLGGYVFGNDQAVNISTDTSRYLATFGIDTQANLLPEEIFNWQTLFTLKGFFLIAVGGFMVGFGTRYARGCTSGHGIFGLSTLQWTSLVATASFFAGGILMTWFGLPYILSL